MLPYAKGLLRGTGILAHALFRMQRQDALLLKTR